MVEIILTGYVLKVGYEVLATPATYLVINWLKRAENVDTFDDHTNFNPFAFGGAPGESLDAEFAKFNAKFREGCRGETWR